MLLIVVSVVWDCLTMEGGSVHIHERCTKMQRLVHMLRCSLTDFIQMLHYEAELLFGATVMGKVACLKLVFQSCIFIR